MFSCQKSSNINRSVFHGVRIVVKKQLTRIGTFLLVPRHYRLQCSAYLLTSVDFCTMQCKRQLIFVQCNANAMLPSTLPYSYKFSYKFIMILPTNLDFSTNFQLIPIIKSSEQQHIIQGKFCTTEMDRNFIIGNRNKKIKKM